MLTFPLVLTGFLAIEVPNPAAQPAEPFAALTKMLERSVPVRLFGQFNLPRKGSDSRSIDEGVVQLSNRRTGVTCTMRIVQAKPSVDPGIRFGAPEQHPDPIVRNSVSPCVE